MTDQEPKDPKLPNFDYSPDIFRSAVLQIEKPLISPELFARAMADGFLEKPEYHITILPSELFDRDSTSPEGMDKINRLCADLEAICQGSIIDFAEPAFMISKPKVYEQGGVVVTKDRLSIVIRISPECDFAKRIFEIYRTWDYPEADLPFLHVTLFYKPDTDIARKGIGIANLAEWESLKPQEIKPL